MAAKSSKKSEAQPLSEEELARRHVRIMAIIDGIKSILLAAVIGCWVWATAYCTFYLPVQASHGENTAVSVTQNLVSSMGLNVSLAWGAAAAGVVWGYTERKKRVRERGERDTRIKELEKQKDPDRTSSGLTPGGKPESKAPRRKEK
jgi:hypothetical protein